MAVQLRVGRVASRTPRAVVCRYSAAMTSRGRLLEHLPVGAPAHGRHGVGQVRHRPVDRRGVCGFDLAALDPSASAHTVDTDFGALNVRSIPPPRAPLEPACAQPPPDLGCLPSIIEMKSRPSTVAPSMPRRASVSGEASHRPGAWVGSPSGTGSSRRALARRSLTPGSGRSRRPWRRRCSLRSSQGLQTPTALETGQRICTARTQRSHSGASSLSGLGGVRRPRPELASGERAARQGCRPACTTPGSVESRPQGGSVTAGEAGVRYLVVAGRRVRSGGQARRSKPAERPYDFQAAARMGSSASAPRCSGGSVSVSRPSRSRM